MMSDKPSHPSESDLVGFLEDKLPKELATRIRRHLRSCPSCQQRSEDISCQRFVDSQQNSVPPPHLTAEHSRDSTIFESPSAPSKSEKTAEEILRNNKTYEFLQSLGEGAMGSVSLVKHRLTERLEVIKIIKPSLLQNPIAHARFANEIRAIAKLNHPNIVQIVTAFDEDGLGLVMEYLPGENLRQQVKRHGPLSEKAVVSLGMQLVAALDHAWSHGIVHRDLKPSNLLLAKTPKGNIVKLIDFGLAITADESIPLNHSTSSKSPKKVPLIGTPEFMAPEQITNPASVDHRADIYSLGCTLYFLLTGRSPFQSNSVETTIQRKLQGTHKRVDEVDSKISKGLSELLERMLATDPSQRPADARTLTAAFNKLRQPIKQSAPSTTPAPKMPEPASDAMNLSPLAGLDNIRKTKRRSSSSSSHLGFAAGSLVFLAILYGLYASGNLNLPFLGSTITIAKRPPGINLFVDGEAIAEPAKDSSNELRVKPGKHRVQIRDDSQNVLWEKEVEIGFNSRFTLDLSFYNPVQPKAKSNESAKNKSESPARPAPTAPSPTAPAPAATSSLPQMTVSNWLDSLLHALQSHSEFQIERSLNLRVDDGNDEVKAGRKIASAWLQYKRTVESSFRKRHSGDMLHWNGLGKIEILDADDTNLKFRWNNEESAFTLESIAPKFIPLLIDLELDPTAMETHLIKCLGLAFLQHPDPQVQNDARYVAVAWLDSNQATQPELRDIARLLKRWIGATPKAPEQQWDMETTPPEMLEVVRQLDAHSGPIFHLYFLPDNQLASSQSLAKSNTPIHRDRFPNMVVQWSLKNGSPTVREVTTGPTWNYQFSPSGKLAVLVTGSTSEAKAQVWSQGLTKPSMELPEVRGMESSFFFSRDGRSCTAITNKEAYFRWSVATNKKLGSGVAALPLPLEGKKHLAFCEKKDLAIAAIDSGRMHAWSIKDWATKYEVAAPEKQDDSQAILHLHVDRDEAHLYVTKRDGSVEVRSLPELNLTSRSRVHLGQLKASGVSLNDRFLAAIDALGWVTVWDMQQGSHKLFRIAKKEDISAVTVDPKGERIAVGFEDGVIQIFRIQSSSNRTQDD